jgi:enoyl-CoA hydratase
MTPLVELEHRQPGVVLLSLNNPARRNALDADLAAALRKAVAECADDRSVRCVVITGRGPSFCSGADLQALMSAEVDGTMRRRDMLSAFYRVFLDVRDLPMPTIAAVNGPAVGAGLNLALCCDLRIAAAAARFGATFARLGIHPGGGASYLLTRLAGPAGAAELMLVGELIDASRALQMGLVNRVVADEELLAGALAVAGSIATNAPSVVRAIKRTLRAAVDASFEATIELETAIQAITQDSPEAAEGWAAFRERRPPVFSD